MSKYQSYSCSKLLDYFDSYYEHSTDRTNYAQYLLTMQKATTVKMLIDIYDKVLWEFILRYQGLGKSHLVSDVWFNINYVSNDTKEYWWSLNVFLNENIIRLYRELDNPTQEQSLECLLNLRKCDNQIPLQKEVVRTAIMAESDAYKKQDVLSKCDEMIHLRDYSYSLRERIQEYPLESNGYQDLKMKYESTMKTLISEGYQKSIVENTFECHSLIAYDSPTMEVGQKNIQNIIKNIVIALIAVIILCVILYFIAKIGIIGIILLIGLPGALIAFIKKG